MSDVARYLPLALMVVLLVEIAIVARRLRRVAPPERKTQPDAWLRFWALRAMIGQIHGLVADVLVVWWMINVLGWD